MGGMAPPYEPAPARPPVFRLGSRAHRGATVCAMDTGTVGVVIRTLNESELIGRCVETLQRQQPGFDLDILVVDSGSTDDTVAIAEAGGARPAHAP